MAGSVCGSSSVHPVRLREHPLLQPCSWFPANCRPFIGLGKFDCAHNELAPAK